MELLQLEKPFQSKEGKFDKRSKDLTKEVSTRPISSWYVPTLHSNLPYPDTSPHTSVLLGVYLGSSGVQGCDFSVNGVEQASPLALQHVCDTQCRHCRCRAGTQAALDWAVKCGIWKVTKVTIKCIAITQILLLLQNIEPFIKIYAHSVIQFTLDNILFSKLYSCWDLGMLLCDSKFSKFSYFLHLDYNL